MNALRPASVAALGILAAAFLTAGGPEFPGYAVDITAGITVARPISPWIYGNFIESGFAHQVDGMWAELLWNRSFEEIPPYSAPLWEWLERKPGDDLTREPWWHSGYEEHEWRLEPSNPLATLTYESNSELPPWDAGGRGGQQIQRPLGRPSPGRPLAAPGCGV